MKIIRKLSKIRIFAFLVFAIVFVLTMQVLFTVAWWFGSNVDKTAHGKTASCWCTCEEKCPNCGGCIEDECCGCDCGCCKPCTCHECDCRKCCCCGGCMEDECCCDDEDCCFPCKCATATDTSLCKCTCEICPYCGGCMEEECCDGCCCCCCCECVPCSCKCVCEKCPTCGGCIEDECCEYCCDCFCDCYPCDCEIITPTPTPTLPPRPPTPVPEATIEEIEMPLSPMFDIFITDHVAYIIGYPEGDVRPGNSITRAEVATVFFRLLREDVRATFWTQENEYPDVIQDSWYNNAISVMTKMEFLEGYPDGSFKPNAFITRAELAAITMRIANQLGLSGDNEVDYTDIAGHWAEEEIIAATMLGWLKGCNDGLFEPDREITRAEFMTLINRLMERVPQSTEDLLLEVMVTWIDNSDPEMWYYIAVQEATNSHSRDYKEETVPGLNFQYEFWEEIEETPDWAALEKEWVEGLSP